MILKQLLHCLLVLLFLGSNLSNGLAQEGCFQSGLMLFNQEEVDDFLINHPNCSVITGPLIISNTDIINLNGISSIKSVGGLYIHSNHLLTDISGLSLIDTINGSLIIQENATLDLLEGLESVKYINGNLEVSSNLFLENLDGLKNLNTVNGSLLIDKNFYLESMKGLNSLEHISTNLTINKCESLKNLSSFNSLKFIGGNINISYNSGLNMLSGFTCLDLVGTESLTIRDNYKLESLEGFKDFKLKNLSDINIINNVNLKTCAIQSLCEYISEDKKITLKGNNEACNDAQSLKSICQNLPKEKSTCQAAPFPNPSTDFLMLTCDCRQHFKIKFQIFDVSGRQINAGIFNNMPIDISTLTPGTYFIKFEDANNVDLSFTFVKI